MDSFDKQAKDDQQLVENVSDSLYNSMVLFIDIVHKSHTQFPVVPPLLFVVHGHGSDLGNLTLAIFISFQHLVIMTSMLAQPTHLFLN